MADKNKNGRNTRIRVNEQPEEVSSPLARRFAQLVMDKCCDKGPIKAIIAGTDPDLVARFLKGMTTTIALSIDDRLQQQGGQHG